MKVDTKVLMAYLSKVSINGKIEKAILDFQKDRVYTKAVDESNVAMMESILDSKVFDGYETLGEIGIHSVAKFAGIIKSFEGVVEITKVENILHIKGNKKEGKFVLPAIEFIKDEREFPTADWKARFPIDKKVFADSIANGAVLGSNKYKIRVKGNSLELETGEQDQLVEFRELESYDAQNDTVAVTLGEILGDILKNCEDKIEVAIGTNIPMMISDKTEVITTRYVIAPIIE
jgi:hypothetical protein